MYITNPSEAQLKVWFQCGKRLADYLIEQGISPISIYKGRYYFVRTETFKNVIDQSPILLRLFN